MSLIFVTGILAGCGSPAQETESQPVAELQAQPETDANAGANVVNVENADEIISLDENQLEGTTITFWHAMGGVNGEALEYLVNKFNEENEYGITVVSEYQGSYDDAINKLKSAQLGNMGADLVQVYDIGTRFMLDSGWVVPMQNLVDADGFDLSVIEPNIAAYYTIGDTLYSMPFNSSTPILYYNKNMFEAAGITEAPASFAEIEEIAPKLQEAGAQEVISLGIYGWFFEQFIGKQGLEYGSDDHCMKRSFTVAECPQYGSSYVI